MSIEQQAQDEVRAGAEDAIRHLREALSWLERGQGKGLDAADLVRPLQRARQALDQADAAIDRGAPAA